MTRARLRVPIEALAPGERELPKEAAAYVARVHRLGEGDRFTAFDPEAAIEAEALVVEVGAAGRKVRVAIEEVWPARLVARRSVTLVQSVGKGDKVDAIVRDATELGATRIAPVLAEHGVVRPDDAAARAQRWRRIAIEAARQCGRGDAPRIDAPAPLLEAVRAIAANASRGDLLACLVPGAPTVLGDALRVLSPAASVTLVIGPEGGLSADEIAACEALGFARFGLGPLVLRTETVCAAVLGALAILAPPFP
jgi:16S rRNA (uracil1498-N3)-methyltransferase